MKKLLILTIALLLATINLYARVNTGGALIESENSSIQMVMAAEDDAGETSTIVQPANVRLSDNGDKMCYFRLEIETTCPDGKTYLVSILYYGKCRKGFYRDAISSVANIVAEIDRYAC